MKYRLLFACTWLIVMMASLTAHAYSFKAGNVYYTITSSANKTVSVVSGDELYSGSVTIPATVTNGNVTYNVTAIAAEAFENCIHLTGVTIGSKVATIGYRAFYGCEELTSVVIPDNVQTIAVRNNVYDNSEAFMGCSALKSVTLGAGITTMGTYAFKDCQNITSLTIKNGCKLISDYSFQGCTKLTTVSIPNSVTKIGNYAFQGCSLLKTLTIGDGVKTIGEEAFQNCSHLNTATLGKTLRTIYYRAFADCTDLTSIILPDSLLSLAVRNSVYDNSEVFLNCTSLEEATIGSKVADMGSGVFMGCTNLRTVTIKEGCSVIGGNCFKGCTKIANITLPNTIKTIGYSAFESCTALKSIVIPNSVITIDENAFYDCDNMLTATIGNGVTSIDQKAFYSCDKLTTVNMGSDVRTIGWQAFANCINLEAITLTDNLVTLAERNSVYDNGEQFMGCTSLTDVTIGAKVAEMGSGVFLNCTALKNVTIKNGCALIGKSCFKGCTKLPAVTIPNTVEEIRDEAFSGCVALKNIIIPQSVITIGNEAFYGCTAMTTATIGDGVTSIGAQAFQNCNKLGSVHLGNDVRTIGYRAFAFCTELSEINLTDQIKTFEQRNSVYSNAETFQGCTSLTRVVLGKKVESMGTGLFLDCTKLKTVEIHDGCAYIGEMCFQGCTSLTEIIIPESVSEIQDNAFYGCSNMTNAIIGDGVTDIGVTAFANCKKLATLTLGADVRTIAYRAFYGCEGLREVVIPDYCTTLAVRNSVYDNGEQFMYCKALKKVTLGKRLTSIATGVFLNCDSIVSVTAKMPEPVDIAANVFPNRTKETLYVDPESKALYQAAQYWKDFGTISDIVPEKAQQTLSLTTLPVMTEGDPSYTLPATTTQGLTLTWTSSDTNVAVISGNVLTVKKTGTSVIKATQAGNNDYLPFIREYTLTVNQKPSIDTNAELTATVPMLRTGQEGTLSIEMNNEDEIIMVEFYLQLPEGISIAMDEDDELDVTISSARNNKHTLEVAQGSDGRYHFLCYSSKNNALKGNSGELFQVRLVCDDDMEPGIYQGALKGILLSDVDKNGINLNDVTFNIEVTDVMPGDVDGDGRINGIDIVKMVSYIMTGSEPGFIFAAGDLVADGVINGLDLVNEVALVLAQDMQQASVRRAASNAVMERGLTLNCLDNGRTTIGVNVPARFILSQFEVQLAEGQQLLDMATDARHQAVWEQTAPGKYNVVCYSCSNASFASNQQMVTILTSGEGDITVSNALLVDENKQGHAFALAGTTGISEMSNEKFGTSSNAYDLQGRRITHTQKGLHIINHKKIVER